MVGCLGSDLNVCGFLPGGQGDVCTAVTKSLCAADPSKTGGCQEVCEQLDWCEAGTNWLDLDRVACSDDMSCPSLICCSGTCCSPGEYCAQGLMCLPGSEPAAALQLGEATFTVEFPYEVTGGSWTSQAK
jgi:hypothetical protein